MNKIKHQISRIAATTAVGLLTTSCGLTSGEAAGEPAIDVREVRSSTQVELPLARFLPAAADEKAYFAAVNVEQKRCARDFGVDSRIPVPEQPSLIEQTSARRFGVVDSADVARYGYRPIPTSAAGAESKADGWNPDARESLVMTAASATGEPLSVDPVTGEDLPEGGCSAAGFQRIDSGQIAPPNNVLVEGLLAEAWELTMADSRALQAERDWSDCMAERGHDFVHRWDAGNSVGAAAEQVQIEMAKLDLRCAEETNYVGIWHAVDSAYQERLIAENQAALEASLADQRDVMGRVTATLEAAS